MPYNLKIVFDLKAKLIEYLNLLLFFRAIIKNGPIILHELRECLLKLRIDHNLLKFHDYLIKDHIV